MRVSRVVMVVVAALMAAVSLVGSATASTRAVTATAAVASVGNDWSDEPLLLVHGFDDTCADAWQAAPTTNPPQPGDDTNAQAYFAPGTSALDPSTLDQVGYYTFTFDGPTDHSSDLTSCSEDINQTPPSGSSGCNSLPDVLANEPSDDYGTINDHIDRLACLFAWYVYDEYTSQSPPVAVNILAHSMGGLVTQYAIGATQAGVPGFPKHPLRVLRVVTVATPHSGIEFPYFQAAKYFSGNAGNELNDLDPTSSTFLAKLESFGKPQGAGGTFWGLMGASDSVYPILGLNSQGDSTVTCPGTPAGYPVEQGNLVSCTAYNLDGAQPDGDGVVPTDSQMAMPADEKVLYGVVDTGLAAGQFTAADPQTQYEHEVNTPGISGNLQPPFYLSDGRTGTTKAFMCTSNCTKTDMSDINLSTPVPVPYSLAEMASMLETPVVQDVSGGGQFAQEWQAAGGADGSLGAPVGHYFTTSSGQEQDFQYGSIYWSAATGTHAIYGSAATDYTAFGGPGSTLGFPQSEALAQSGGGVAWQFPGTSCTVTAMSGSGAVIMMDGPTYTTGKVTPGAEVQGCIYQAYSQLDGGPGGALGYPTADEKPMSTGRVSYFTGGAAKPGCSTGSEPADGMTTAALYWDGTVHSVTGCIFAEYYALGEAAGNLGFPTDEAYAYNGGHRQDFQDGYISGSNGSYSATYGGSQWVVGHAQHAGDDYPYETIGQFEHQSEGTDAWAEYYGQCDSFAAWKVYENLYGATGNPIMHPSNVPAPGWTPPDPSISPVNQNTWFNADNWDVMWRDQTQVPGVTVNTVPVPGAIAYWPNATADPQDGHPTSANGMGEFGHVGYVTDVYPDGSVTIEMYNLRLNGEYSTIHMAYGQSAVDTSYNLGAFTVPWPTDFIHVADGPSPDSSSPAEPANGTVAWGYPTQVKVIGPGSSSSQYSLAGTWTKQPGHGELGSEEWTHTSGATATYTPSGLAASACYRIDALVPDNYANNPVAAYTVSDVNGAHLAAVNENVFTNDWAELGVYETNSSGVVTVTLDSRGTASGVYVAADAMRFWRQATCGSYGDVSPILMPGTTNGTWMGDSGHGFSGTMKYAATSGSLGGSSANAGWLPTTLVPNACYEVSTYVPDNYSDNNAARYQVIDSYYGTFWPQVNENAFTNQFAPIGGFIASSSGQMSVVLTNMGPSGQYVGADAVAFALDPLCEGPTQTGLGPVYPTGTVGPGSSPANFVTTQQWYLRLGHGYAYHELWTYDNGSTADSTATWAFAGAANACYSVQAYIPDNFADNPQAHYAVSTSLVSAPALTVNQQGYTDQFVWLASIRTGSDGGVHVQLTDQGPATDSSGNALYTAADAMEFIENGPGC